MAFFSPSTFSTVSSDDEKDDVVPGNSNSITEVPSEIRVNSSFNLQYAKRCMDLTSVLQKPTIRKMISPTVRMQSSIGEGKWIWQRINDSWHWDSMDEFESYKLHDLQHVRSDFGVVQLPHAFDLNKLVLTCNINEGYDLWMKLFGETLTRPDVDELNIWAGALVSAASGKERDIKHATMLSETGVRKYRSVQSIEVLATLLTFANFEGTAGQNRARAIELYELAIDSAQNIHALNNLAVLLLDDTDGCQKKNTRRAVELLERAYSLGSVPSTTNLANILANGGEGVPRDALRAKMLYEEAMGMGDVNALNNLASLLITGAPGLEQDPIRGASLYVHGILEYGSVLSMMNLANILDAYFHFNPNVVSQLRESTLQKSPKRFIELLAQEIEKAEDPMMEQLAKSIMRNHASYRSPILTKNKSSEQILLDEIPDDQLSTDNPPLSNISVQSECKEKSNDVQLMNYYCREIEETGSVQAILNMADLLKKGGNDVPQDVPRAILLYEKAIEDGENQALHLLADLLTTDKSGNQLCRARVAELYQEAIENGNVESMYKLSCILTQRWSDLSPDIIRAVHLCEKYVDCLKQDGMCVKSVSCSIIDSAVEAFSRENFVKMMSLVNNGTEISREDVRLIVENDTHKNLIYMESTSVSLQLEKSGIFFELIEGESDMATQADYDGIIQFKTGPSQRTVIVDVTRLTPTGLSILSWILLPSPENIKAISNVMKASQFNNCLVEAITGTKFESNPPVKLVVPMGWLFWLGIPSSFIVEHGYVEDFAVCIGNPDTTKLTTLDPLWKRLRTGTIFLKKRKEFDPEPFDDSKTEFLFLDTDHQLIYIPDLVPKQELVGISVGGEAFGFGVSIGGEIQKSIDYEEGKRAIARGSIHRFVDFNNFIGLPMKSEVWGQILKRTEWLSKLLNARYMFPSGYNRGLLRMLTGIDDQPSEAKIFEKEDCLVKYSSLQKRGVRQNRRGDMITIIFPGANGMKNKRLVFNANELCKVQDTLGPRDTYKIPEIQFQTALEHCEQCSCNILESSSTLSASSDTFEEEGPSSVEGCEHCGSGCEMVKIYMG